MNSEQDNGSSIHVYKRKRGILVFNIIYWIFFIGLMSLPFAGILLAIGSLFKAGNEFDIFAFALGLILIPIMILFIFNIVLLTTNVIMSFFSYVKISPDGIEEKISPFKHIRCDWPEVDKLGKLFLFTDVIYLNSFEKLGFSLSLMPPFSFFRPRNGFIALTGYEGWPNGQLADDLKGFAPELFEDRPEKEEVQEIGSAVLSQDVRLLAAISHATILFANVGYLIPLGIYMIQKKKSSYLGFQALQALVWQFAAFIFFLLSTFCMLSLVPIILITASQQNEKLIEYSVGLMSLGIFAVVMLMSLVSLIFVLYGLVGAVKTYRGKDFRYAFIGNWIEKKIGANPTKTA